MRETHFEAGRTRGTESTRDFQATEIIEASNTTYRLGGQNRTDLERRLSRKTKSRPPNSPWSDSKPSRCLQRGRNCARTTGSRESRKSTKSMALETFPENLIVNRAA